MLSEKVTFSLPCLKSLVTSENSCVYCKSNYKRSLILLPLHLQDLKQSVREILASKVTTYDIELGGIILSHKNVKICSSVEMNDDGHFTLEYVADIYIFTPEIGCTLSGRINKKGRDVLGCLVHSVFNVALPRPRNDDDSPKKWKGSKAFIGQTVTFTVVKLDFTGRLPYIRGQLIKLEHKGGSDDDGADSGMGYQESNEDCCITSVTRDDPQTSSAENNLHSSKRKRNSSGSITDSPKPRKKRFQGNSSDEGLSGEGSLCTDHLSLDISKGSSNNDREKGENSSKKIGVSNFEEGLLKIKEEPTDDTTTEVNTLAKSKKKKKEKKIHSSLTDFEGLSSSLLKEALAKTKIKTEDTSSEDTSQASMPSNLSSKRSKVSKTERHSKGKISENLENLSLSLLKEAMETNQHREKNTQILTNNLLENNVKDGRDEISEKKKKKKKKHPDNEEVEHHSKEKLETDELTASSEDSKNIAGRIEIKKEKANVDSELSSKKLIQTKLRPVTVKQEIEEMGEVKKKKKKHKESDGMSDISSALLEQAIKDLSVKIEDVKQENEEQLSASNVSTKTSSKRKKNKERKKES